MLEQKVSFPIYSIVFAAFSYKFTMQRTIHLNRYKSYNRAIGRLYALLRRTVSKLRVLM